MNRWLTLMVIPHNDDQVREFNLAPAVIWAGAALLFLFLVITLYFGYGYYVGEETEAAYASLRTENAELEAHLKTIRDRMSGLDDRVEDLSRANSRIRAFARMTDPTERAEVVDETGMDNVSGGYGYGETEQVGYASLDQLTREARLLAAGLDTIRSALLRAGDDRRYIPSIFPVRGEGWYSSTFGYRTDPITGQRSFNNGVDIAGRKGTPIVATADGTVEATRYHARLGHMVTIDHTNGLRTVYAHLESHDTVKPGEKVTRGDVIGRMSRSGRTTAVHLHYAVIRNNRAQDPLDYILDSRSRRTLF